MILMDEMIPMKLYSSKQKAYLPFNPTNKRKGSLVTLLTRDIDDSIDLMKMSFFNNPSYYTSYYLDRNVKRYLSNDGNIQIEGEEEDPDIIEEAVMRKIDRNSPTITCYGNANDKRLLEKYFTKKAFEKWYDYFNVRKQSRIYPAVYGFNSREDMFKAVGQTAIEKHGQIICNSYNSSTEIVLLNNSEYSIIESDGPYAMYCEAAIITFVIHNGFRNATFQLANNMATHLSGQDQWLYAKNDYKSDDKIGMALLIGKYDEKYGRQGMIKLARSGDYYLLVQFGAKNFIDRIAKAAKHENAFLEYTPVFPITELADIPDNKIIVGTDYHFIGYNDDKSKIIVKPKSYTDKIIKMQNDLTGDDGVFIFLGDLFFRSFRTEFEIPGEMKEEGIKLAKRLKGKYKILIRGNHDNLPDEFYIEKCGFTHVCSSVVYNNILFTHQPELVNPPMINVHGHIHGARQYLEKEPHSHMDVWTMNSCHTGTLPDILDKQEEYDKTTKQIKDPSKGDPYQYIPGQRLELDAIINESALLESDGTHLDVVRIYKNMSDKDQKFIAVDQRFQNWGPLKDDNCIYRHIERNGLMDVYGFIEAYGDLDNGASIVIGVDPRHRGEGVASKMMEQMLKELPKEHPEIEHLVWRADAKNSKSQKLAEKFGFKLIRKNPLQVVYRRWIKNEREDYKYIDKSVLDEVSLVKWMRSKFEIDEKLNENTTKLRSIKDITHSKKITNMEAGLVVFTALKKMGLNTMMTIFCEHNGSIDTVGQVFPLVMHTYGDWQEETLLVDPFDKELKSGIGRLKIAQYFEYGEMLHREGRWGVSERPMLFSYNPYEEELKAGNDIYKDILKVQNLTESTLLEFTTKNKIAPPEEMNSKLPMSLSRLKKIKLDDKVIKKYEAHLDGLSHVRTTNNCTGYLWVDPKHKVRMTDLEIPVCYYNVQHKKDKNSDTGEIIWIQALEVNPDYQGRGLAKQLLDICINEEHATNLAVNKDNEVAIRLYRSKGFVPYVTNGSMINMQRPIKHESLFISPNDKGVMMVENTMFVFTEELSQTAYNTKLRQYLYKDRLKTTSMQIDIYNRVKSEIPMIRRAYVKPEMYKGLNTFIDLSYYNGLFLKNIGYQRDIAIRFYWEYLNRMLKGTDPYFRENYSRNTIFVPVWVGAWDVQKDTYVYDWKANVNPISMIFRMIRRNPAELATLSAYNFIFVGREGYFRVDFSNFSISSLIKFKRNLEKLYNREHISDDEDEDGYGRSPAVGGNADDTTSSTAAISAQIIDKIEDSSGIEINNISAAVGKSKQNLTNLAKPNLNDASALDTIPDMTIISKSVKIPEKNVGIGIMSPGEESMLATMKMTKDIFKNGNFGYLISK